MAGLVTCLKKLGLEKHEAAILRGRAAEWREDGLEARDAASKAIRESIERTVTERSDIREQVRKQTGDDIGEGLDVRDVMAAPKPNRSLLQEILNAGGLRSDLALDLVGEKAFVANRRLGGLFKKSGKNLDELIEALRQRGWFNESALDEAGNVDGGVQQLRDMIAGEYRGERSVRMDEADQYAEAEWKRAQEEARVDDEEAQAVVDDLKAADLEESPENLIDADLVAKANEINPALIESLPDSMEPADFMRVVREIVNGSDQSRQAQESGRADRQEARMAKEEPPVAERDAGGGRQEPAIEQEPVVRGDNEPSVGKRADDAVERDSDGGTLYGGIPLAPIAKGIAKAFGWTGPNTRAYLSKVQDFWSSMFDAAKNVRGPKGHPVRNFASMLFDTSSGHMRRVASDYKSKTLDWVIDQFHSPSGKTDRAIAQTYGDQMEAESTKFLRQLSKGLGDLVEDKAAMRQLVTLIRNPQNIRAGTKLGDAANSVRKLLDDALKYMRAAGVDLGEVKDGYYPREFDNALVLQRTGEFVDAVAQAYRENGMDAKTALDAAKVLADHVVHGGFDTIFRPDKGNIRAPFIKGRVFGKSVDAESHPLNKFLVADPALNLAQYLNRAVRRAEIARRFGDGFSKWEDLSKKILDEGGAGALEELKDYMSIAAGLRRQGATFGLRGASYLRTWATLGLLEKATLSSLQEFVTPAVRSGNWVDAARSLRGTLSALVKSSKGQELRDLAEDMNLIGDGIADSVQAARFSGGDIIGMKQSELLAKYFRRTGLEQWTQATIAGSVGVGRTFIRRMAKRAAEGNKLAREALVEMGIPEAEIKAFADSLLKVSDGMPVAGEIKGKWGDQYRTAMRRFSHQSIMRPNATDRPKWANNPFGSVIFQLQSYNYAFFEHVLKRAGRMAWKGATDNSYDFADRMRLLMPMATLPLLYAVGGLVGEARDAVLGDPHRRKEEETWQKLLKAQSRSVPVAPIDPVVNLLSNARYQASSLSMLSGPGLSTLGRGLDAAKGLTLNNSDKNNTAERAAARAFYDLVLEPGANFALSGLHFGPGSTIAAAAATQALGAGATREAFVSGMAGDKAQKKKRGQGLESLIQ